MDTPARVLMLCGRPRLEGIEKRSTATCDVGDVASNQSPTPDPGRCRQQAVDNGQWVRDVQAAPLLSDVGVDVNNAIPVDHLQASQPLFQYLCLFAVPTPQSLDPDPNLADGQRADKDLSGRDRLIPGENAGVRTGLAQLRYDICIEQVGHASAAQSMLRGSSVDLVRSRSSKPGPDRR